MKLDKSETMYVCQSSRGDIDMFTLRYYRKDSIKALIEEGVFSWSDAKKYGWSCIKVRVTLNNPHQ